MSHLTPEQDDLLERLVAIAQDVTPRTWEAFVALRTGLTGATVFHPRARPLPINDLADVDALAEAGFIDLTRTPSGARVFRITRNGYSYRPMVLRDSA